MLLALAIACAAAAGATFAASDEAPRLARWMEIVGTLRVGDAQDRLPADIAQSGPSLRHRRAIRSVLVAGACALGLPTRRPPARAAAAPGR